MSGRVLLDTNAVIAIFAGEGPVLALAANADCHVPSIVVGELVYGAWYSERVEANLAKIRAFYSTATIVPCDERTAEEYGRIKNELRTKGRPIPENDVWIAAIAKQHDLQLVSRDEHFAEVAGLSRTAW